MRHRLETQGARDRFLGYVAAMFSLDSTEELMSHLRGLTPPENYRVRTKVLYAPDGVLEVTGDLAKSGFIRKLDAHSGSGRGFVFTATVEGEKEPVFFAILPTEQPHASALTTVARRDAWLALLRELRRHYPSLVPVLLSQKELLQSVSTLQARALSSYDLRMRELSAREAFVSPEGRRIKSVREWTFEEWERALALVAERRRTVVSVGLDFHRRIGDHIDVSPAASCRIAKSGEVDLTGNFDLVWRFVIEHIAQVGERKLTFYAKRGLRERGYRAAPLSIRYSHPLFESAETVRRLVDVLRAYPRSMHSVQHGNPYAYVQIADSFDGSSFDVWAISPDAISIVPRLKATEAAVARLIQWVFEEFQEGTVEANVAE